MIHYAAAAALYFVVGMWCYAIYVALYLSSKRGELTKTWMILGALPLFIGYLIDVLVFNFIIATLVYEEWPEERTFTARLNRWYRDVINKIPMNRSQLAFTLWWAKQLNALTPSILEHIHNHDRA